MTIMSGARAFLEMLRAEGVEVMFGNPGTSESAIMALLPEFPDIRYMLATQEGVAMGMADGYSVAGSRPAVVNLHIETGLANGISLLHHAMDGGVPLVLTAGNKDVRKLTEYRTELAGMVNQFTKWSVEATHPEQIPGIMRRAFQEAKNPPSGPVFVGFSANALDGMAEMAIVPSAPPHLPPPPHLQEIQAAAQLLASASNPLIVVGDRLAQAEGMTAAVTVAEQCGAGVYAASIARNNFPYRPSPVSWARQSHPVPGSQAAGRCRRDSGSWSQRIFGLLLFVGQHPRTWHQAHSPGLGPTRDRQNGTHRRGPVRRPQVRPGTAGPSP